MLLVVNDSVSAGQSSLEHTSCYEILLPETTAWLFQRQECFDTVQVRFVNKTRLRQISLLLFGLLRQNVTLVRMLPLDFPCSGKGEPLFGTGISLHFWHFALLELMIV
jgi:hypothetical protein